MTDDPAPGPAKTRVAFIGAGRMASAMVRGMVGRGGFIPENITCLDGGDDTGRSLAAATGIRAAVSVDDLLADADIVVAACKPQHLAELPAAVAQGTAGRLVISLLAGKRLERLSRTFPRVRNLVRTMPNTPGQIGAGITGYSWRTDPSPIDRTTVADILASLGVSVELPEEKLDAVTAIGGSGPGFVFEFAAALMAAAEKAGLDRATADLFVRETLLGAARLLRESGESPDTLRDQVTSPGGTTFAGLEAMKARDFRAAIQAAVAAATRRSEELSRD